MIIDTNTLWTASCVCNPDIKKLSIKVERVACQGHINVLWNEKKKLECMRIENSCFVGDER